MATNNGVFLHGPVSAMVGADLAGLAVQASRASGHKVVAVECTTSAFHDEGLSRAMMAVYAQVKSGLASSGEPTSREGGDEPRQGANVLGLNAVDCHDLAWRTLLLERIEHAAALPVISVWGCRDYWPQWEKARFARENIVASASALKLAKAMKRDWGIPYRRIDELDLELPPLTPARVLARAPRVLVVHEQLIANVTRRLFEDAGCVVDVASFLKMDRSAKREGDHHLKSEADLVTFLKMRDYDILVGDPALLGCVDDVNAVSFIPLEHSAIAPVLAQGKVQPVPFTQEWAQNARGALESLSARPQTAKPQ